MQKKSEITQYVLDVCQYIALVYKKQWDEKSFKLMTYRRKDFNSLLTLKLKLDDDFYIIKFPRFKDSDIAAKSIKDEFENLSYLNSLNVDNIPRNVNLYLYDLCPVLVMPFYEGSELWDYFEQIKSFDDFLSLYSQGIGMIEDIVKKTSENKINIASDDFIDEFLRQPYGEIKKFLTNIEESDKYLEFIVDSCKSLDLEMPLCFEHMEFNPYNILINSDRSFTVLDFEDAKVKGGSPLSDFFNFTVMSLRTIRSSGFSKSIENMYEKPTSQLLFLLNDIAESFCESIGLPFEVLDILFVSYYLKTAAFFNTEKRPSSGYSANWYYFMNSHLKDNIFLTSLIIEEKNNS